MRDIQHYPTGSWAVQRWDKFNGGKMVEPLSFCQFWRTVILWASLAAVPILGKLFLAHLHVRPTSDERAVSQAKFDRQLDKIGRVLGPAARFVWALLLPVRWVFNTVVQGLINVINFIDEADTKKLETLIVGLIIVISLGVVGFVVFMIGWGILLAWQANWVVAMIVSFGAPTLLVAVALLTMRLAGPVWGVVELGWDVAVTSKHRVCPPMTIDRYD